MDLNEIRSEIDKIDDELVRLFCQRMHVAAQVADYKKANNLPIFQPARERAKLQDVAEEFLTYAPHKEVYAYLKMTDENGKTPSPGMLFDFMDSTDEVLGIIQGDFGVQDEQSQKKVYTDCVRKLKKEYYNKIIKDLLTEYSSADDEKKAEIAEKIKEYQILMRKN